MKELATSMAFAAAGMVGWKASEAFVSAPALGGSLRGQAEVQAAKEIQYGSLKEGGQEASTFAGTTTMSGLAASAAAAMAVAGHRRRKRTANKVAAGDSVPDVGLDLGFPPEKVNLKEYCKGKKVVLVGLPGAFTPT